MAYNAMHYSRYIVAERNFYSCHFKINVCKDGLECYADEDICTDENECSDGTDEENCPEG